MLNLLCFTQFLSIRSLSALLTACIILFSVLFPYSEYGVYLFLTLPFFNVLNFNMGSVSMYYLLIGMAMFLYIWRGGDRQIVFKGFLFLAIIFVTISNIADLREYVSWILRILPFIFLINTPMITYKLKRIIYLYSLSMLFASVWGWMMLKTGVSIYDSGYVWVSTVGSTTRLAGLVGDSVVYGNQLILLISLLLIMIFKSKYNRRVYITLIVAFILFGSMTYSKSFFLCLLIEMILFYFYWLFHSEKKSNFMIANLFILLVTVIGFATFIYLLQHSGNIFFISLRTRLHSGDLLTGRLAIWNNYISWFVRHPSIIVKGMCISEYKALGWAHNLFLETVALFGVIETVVLFLTFLGWVIRTCRLRKDEIFLFPILILLAIGMTVHGHMEFAFYMNLLLVFSCIKWLDCKELRFLRGETVPL